MNAHFFSGLRLPLVWRRQLSPLRTGEAGRRFVTRLVSVPLAPDSAPNAERFRLQARAGDDRRHAPRFHHAIETDDRAYTDQWMGGRRPEDGRTAVPVPGPSGLRPDGLGDLRRWARR